MSRLSFSPAAREDLIDIFDYISKDGPEAARRFVNKLMNYAGA
jgi:plasmid stabilization system protein ParE